MHHRPLISLVAAILIAVLPSQARAQTPETPPAAPTQMSLFEPFSPSGAMNSDIHVERTVAGSCQGGSNIDFNRGDAWLCMVGSTTYDPCFENRDQTKVACPDFAASPSPSAEALFNVVVIEVTDSLPVESGNLAFPQPSPFFFQLSDGQFCAPETDGAIFAGTPVLGFCPNGLWYGLFDQSKPLWLVPILAQGSSGSVSDLTNRAVTRAWY